MGRTKIVDPLPGRFNTTNSNKNGSVVDPDFDPYGPHLAEHEPPIWGLPLLGFHIRLG
jgi:hypothetical protein